MHYSEVSKDLLTVFNSRDETIVKKELSVGQEGSADGNSMSAQSAQEEEKSEDAPPAKAIDPAKLAAQMLKQQAAAKKAATAAKKPAAKAAAPAKPAQPAKKPAQTKDEAPAHQPMDKEKRNKADREQLLNYIKEIQRIKGDQVEAAL